MAHSGLSIAQWCERVPLFQLISALLLLFFVSPFVGFLLGVDASLPVLDRWQALAQQSPAAGPVVLLLLAIPAVAFYIQVTRPPRVMTKFSMIEGHMGSLASPGIAWLRRCNRWLQALSSWQYLLGLAMLTVALRLAWVLLVPTAPYSDFMGYHQAAIQISHLIPADLGQIYFGQKGLTFVLMLGALYRLAGADLMIAKIANIVLGVILVLLIVGLTRISLDEQTARVAGLLAALLPSQIMMTSTVASEHLFTVLILLSLLIVVKRVIPKQTGCTWLLGAGLILGITYSVRFVAIAVWLAVLVYLFCAGDRDIKSRLSGLISFVVGFLIVVASLSGLILVTHTPSLPGQGFEFSFLEGTNFTTSGAYSPEIQAQFQSWPPESARHQALMTGIHQVIDTPGQFCVLMIKKVDKMWGGDYSAVRWAVYDNPDDLPILPMAAVAVLVLISQGYYMGLLLIGAMGAYLLSKRSNRTDLYLYPLVLGAIFCVHSLLEVQQRYHFPFEFAIIILAAWAISRMIKCKNAGESGI